MSVAETTATGTSSAKSHWGVAIGSLAVTYAVVVWLFDASARSMLGIWDASETYAHGYVILPISLWLVWGKRRELARLQPQPSYLAALVLASIVLVWALANLTSTLVIEHLAFVAILVASTWVILGHRIVRVLIFPLFFLFLAVPVGQDLVPPLMEFTADFTVGMLQLSGIPVFREGLYFEVPSGRWSVVEACSGIRYLIASVTLGFLYAYLVYASLWKRALFVVLSALVPIVANGFRAYLIVLIGHLSDMKLAVGVDHLIYGWVFFGLVMAVLFWIGSFWSDTRGGEETPNQSAPNRRESSPLAPIVAAGLVVAIAALGTESVKSGTERSRTLRASLALPAAVSGWTKSAGEEVAWRPAIQNPVAEVSSVYKRGDAQALLYLAAFPAQQRRSEAVNSMNRLADPNGRQWKTDSQGQIVVADGKLTVGVANLSRVGAASNPGGYRVWQWYRIGAHHVAHPYVAKLLEVQNLLLEDRTDGAYIVVATPLDSDESAADKILERFMSAALPVIDERIDHAVFGAGDSR